MSDQAIDLDTIDIDELVKLANAELNPTTEKKEDEPAAAPVQQDDPEQEEELVYRREIDLGDGSGVQVFEGSSYDELIDKLANAQLHATRKIKELSTAKKARRRTRS